MLMNGQKVNHLVIAGEAFDKSYAGKKVQLTKNVNMDSGITYSGNYYDGGGTGGTWSAGRTGLVILTKYLNYYYICDYVANDRYSKGTWCTEDAIKILD